MKKKDETKRIKILDATVNLIMELGAAEVSTTKVAKRVGIAQSNIYLYFKDKDDLLNNVYLRELEQISRTSSFIKLQDRSLSLEVRLLNYIHSIYDYALVNPNSLVVMAQIKSLVQPGIDYFADVLKVANPVFDLLTEAMEAHILKPTHISLHMTTVFGIIQRHSQNILHQVYTEQQVSYEDILATIWDAITVSDIRLDQFVDEL